MPPIDPKLKIEMERRRPMWTAGSGNGAENDRGSWLTYNPTVSEMKAILSLIDTPNAITGEKIEKDQSLDTIPKRVKLSDGAVAILVLIGVSTTLCSTLWPLDFSAQSKLRNSPPRVNMGTGLAYDDNILQSNKEDLCGNSPIIRYTTLKIDVLVGNRPTLLQSHRWKI